MPTLSRPRYDRDAALAAYEQEQQKRRAPLAMALWDDINAFLDSNDSAHLTAREREEWTMYLVALGSCGHALTGDITRETDAEYRRRLAGLKRCESCRHRVSEHDEFGHCQDECPCGPSIDECTGAKSGACGYCANGLAAKREYLAANGHSETPGCCGFHEWKRRQ